LIKSKLAAGSVIPSPRPISDLIVTSAAPPPTAEWRKGECLAKFARPCGVDVGPCGADSYGNGPFQSATSVLVEKYGFQSVQNIALAIDCIGSPKTLAALAAQVFNKDLEVTSRMGNRGLRAFISSKMEELYERHTKIWIGGAIA